MNIQTATIILFNNGYIINHNDDGDMIAVSHPTRSVTINEVQALLTPYDSNFVTFYKIREYVQIFFD